MPRPESTNTGVSSERSVGRGASGAGSSSSDWMPQRQCPPVLLHCISRLTMPQHDVVSTTWQHEVATQSSVCAALKAAAGKANCCESSNRMRTRGSGMFMALYRVRPTLSERRRARFYFNRSIWNGQNCHWRVIGRPIGTSIVGDCCNCALRISSYVSQSLSECAAGIFAELSLLTERIAAARPMDLYQLPRREKGTVSRRQQASASC